MFFFMCPLQYLFLKGSHFDISTDDSEKAGGNQSLPVRAGKVLWAGHHLDRPPICHATTFTLLRCNCVLHREMAEHIRLQQAFIRDAP